MTEHTNGVVAHAQQGPSPRLNSALLVAASIAWLLLAIPSTPLTRRALFNKGVPHPEWLLAATYALWILLGLPQLLACWRLARSSRETASPLLLTLATQLLCGAVVAAAWLAAFRFPIYLVAVFALNVFGPFAIAAARLSQLPAIAAANSRLDSFAGRAFSRGGPLALSLASVAVFSVLLEGGFSLLTGRQPRVVDAYGTRSDFVLSPYVMFAEPDVEHGGITNRQGFLGPEFPGTKLAGERRVAVLGGSVVWQGKHHDSIASHLEKVLQEKRPGLAVRVANFGRQSYISMQELILLQRSVLPLQVDLVVVLDGFNDLAVPWRMEPLGVGHPFLFSELKKITEISLSRVALWNLHRDAMAHSALFAALDDIRGGRAGQPQAVRFDIAALEAEYGRNLDQMAALARHGGAEVLLATQPFVGTKRRRTPREDSYYAPEDLRVWQEHYVRLVNTARAAAERGGARHLDLSDVFDGIDGEMYEDQVHFAGHGGNPLVAARLAAEIEAAGLLR